MSEKNPSSPSQLNFDDGYGYEYLVYSLTKIFSNLALDLQPMFAIFHESQLPLT